jgi:hypothetical protein
MGFTYGPGGGSNTLSVPGGYTILEDSGITEAITGDGPMATVKFKVLRAADRYSFCQQLLGLWTGTPPGNIFYTLPYEYPPSPNLLCTQIPEIIGFDKPLPLSVGLPWLFKKSTIVTAVFTRPPWQAATNAGFFSIDFSASGEFLTIPETTYRFGDGTPTMTPIGVVMPEAQITVTRHRMPFLPDQYAMPLIGTINNAPFIIGWNTYPTSTLLFSGMTSEIAPDPLGNIAFTVKYIFTFRPVNWNYYLHPNRTTGFALITDGNGNSPYQFGNFNILP